MADTQTPVIPPPDTRAEGAGGGPETKSQVPARVPPLSRASVDYWCNLLVGNIILGRLRAVPRITSVINHLSAAQELDKPGSAEDAKVAVPERTPLPQTTKNLTKYVYITNPFASEVVSEVFCSIGSKINEFGFSGLISALYYNDFSKIIDVDHLPLAPNNVVIPFFLVLLYVRLTKSTPQTTGVIYSVLERVAERRPECSMLGSQVKIEDLVKALSERTLRFKDPSHHNATTGTPAVPVKRTRPLSRLNLFFNELFEMAQLDFMSFQKRLDSMAKEEFYGDREFKSYSEKVQDSFNQQECFRRIHEFLDTSEKIVLSNLRFLNDPKQELAEQTLNRENVSLLNHLIRLGLNGRLQSTEIMEQCLRLLIKWCNQPTTASSFLAKQSTMLQTAQLVTEVLSKPTPGRLYSICLFFLGVASALLLPADVSKYCFVTFMHAMDQTPELIVRNKFLAIILNGLASLLGNISIDEFTDATTALVSMWAKVPPSAPPRFAPPPPPSTATTASTPTSSSAPAETPAADESSPPGELRAIGPIPSLEDQLRVFQLFGLVYSFRTANSEARIADKAAGFSASLLQTQPQFRSARNRDELKAQVGKFTAEAREQEEEWLIAAGQILHSLFTSKAHPATEFMSLCAGAGIWREMSRANKKTPVDCIETFNSMLTTAIMNVKINGDLPNWSDWRKTVAVICVHIDKSLPFISDEVLLQLVMDVLLEDIMSISWILEEELPGPRDLAKQVELVKKIEAHRQQGLFRMANIFTRAAASIYANTKNLSVQFAILLKLGNFALNLHQQWATFSRKTQQVRVPKSTTPGSGTEEGSQKQANSNFATAAAQTFLESSSPLPAPPQANTANTSPSTAPAPQTQAPAQGSTLPSLDSGTRSLPGAKAASAGGSGDTGLDKILKPIFTVIFLSCVTFIKFVQDIFKAEHCTVALKILSNIEFCSVKGYSPYDEVLDYLTSVLAVSDPHYLQLLGNSLASEWVTDVSAITKQKLDAMEKMPLSRLRFFVSVLEIVISKDTKILSTEHSLFHDRLLPLLFLLLTHSHRPTNRKAHQVFRQIFSQTHPLREELIPYYLKLAFKNYPETTPVETIQESTLAIITKLPDSHPLIPYTINIIAEKIKTTRQSKNATLLLIVLFRHIAQIPLSSLGHLLKVSEGLVLTSPRKLQVLLVKLLFSIIANNYDYTRKHACVTWYLELQRKAQVFHPEAFPTPTASHHPPPLPPQQHSTSIQPERK